MQVREVRDSDAPAWKQRRGELWESDDHGDVDAFFAGNEAPIETAFVLVREDGEVGGFIELSIRNYAEGCDGPQVPYVEGWAVDEDLRRQGGGRALVEAAENWARERGFRELASDCALDNSVSETAHKQLGFEETDRIICLRKALD